ncbi:MAG: hypothetical protein MUC65_09590 [Pontiellaceae bacterium]|jgi:hypothetical protein|nr:hypothetical protein [Pontiellaceae bacterium]
MKKGMKKVGIILPGVLFLFAGYAAPQAVADETVIHFIRPGEPLPDVSALPMVQPVRLVEKKGNTVSFESNPTSAG